MPSWFIYIHTPAQYKIKEILKLQDQTEVWQLQSRECWRKQGRDSREYHGNHHPTAERRHSQIYTTTFWNLLAQWFLKTFVLLLFFFFVFFLVYARLPHYLPIFRVRKLNWTHISIIWLSDLCAPFFRTDKSPLSGHQQGSCHNAIFKTVKGRNKAAVSCSRTGLGLWCPALSCRKLNWEQRHNQTPGEVTAKANRVIGHGSGAVHLLHQPRLGAENIFSFPW